MMGLPNSKRSLVFALALAAGGAACRPAPQPAAPREQPAEASDPTPALADRGAFWKRLGSHSKWLSQRVAQSVVQVRALQTDDGDDLPPDALQELFGTPDDDRLAGQGSGLIVTSDGHIITNYHVIRQARRIEVLTPDGSRLFATRVGEDALTDLAVIRIDAQGLAAAVWGDSEDLEVGEFVWAVGNPFGLAGSVSFGIISARDRQGLAGNDLYDFLQTDAAINPGNSGGPLVNAEGHVIGINTAIVGQTYRGIGFAIPSQTARHVYHQICTAGRVQRGWIGVALDSVPAQQVAALGWSRPQGAYVQSLTHRNGPSPGAGAGLQAGDIILTWNGAAVAGPVVLARLIAQSEVGAAARVTIVRDGVESELTIDVAARP